MSNIQVQHKFFSFLYFSFTETKQNPLQLYLKGVLHSYVLSCLINKSHPLLVARLTMISEAVAAVHGLVAARLEGNLSLLAAISANRGVHLTLRTSVAILSAERRTALRAAARLILEAFLRIESLLGSSEHEFFAAVTASEGFILIHNCILLKIFTFTGWHSQ